jgi:hypothetical protein
MKKEETGILIFTLFMSGIILIVIFLSRFLPDELYHSYIISNHPEFSFGYYLNLIAGSISLFLALLLLNKTKRQRSKV